MSSEEKINCDKNVEEGNNGLDASGDQYSDANDQLPSNVIEDYVPREEDEDEVSDFTDDEDFKKEEEANLSDDQLLSRKEESKELKGDGNLKFSERNYVDAIAFYTMSLRLCPLQCLPERAVLFSNRATARSRISPSSVVILEKIVKDCTKSLDADSAYLKPLIRRAQTFRELGGDRLDDSLADYKKILELDPNNREANVAVVELKSEIAERNEKLKTDMMEKLQDLGNLVLKPFGLSTSNFQLTPNPETGGYSMNFKQK